MNRRDAIKLTTLGIVAVPAAILADVTAKVATTVRGSSTSSHEDLDFMALMFYVEYTLENGEDKHYFIMGAYGKPITIHPDPLTLKIDGNFITVRGTGAKVKVGKVSVAIGISGNNLSALEIIQVDETVDEHTSVIVQRVGGDQAHPVKIISNNLT